ncbi:MAG TPA: 50S ribosomal protein L25 [Acidimicrobiia bacterium]|nr:50S ribosomal protein L25 [Acidimicrobiia bacterium]
MSSEQITLRAETGRSTGSRASRRLRREGHVPAVVYGKGADPLSIAVDHRELRAALTTEAGLNALISLEVGKDKILTLPRVVETHPFRREIRHVDFVTVSLTDTVHTEIPVHFVGESVGIEAGGVLSTARNVVQIEALVTNIPSFVELDISSLEIGDALRISDLPEIDGVVYLEEPEYTVVSITVPAAEVEPEEVEDEDAEGEEAEGDEGEEAGGDGAAEESSEDGTGGGDTRE